MNAGVIAGHQGGLLKPDDFITRAEAANLVGKIFPPGNQNVNYKDTIPVWASGLINATANGIVAGYPDGAFRPDNIITKSETLTLLQKTLESYPPAV